MLDSPLAAEVPLLGRVLFEVGGTPITVGRLIAAAVVIVLTFSLSRLLQRGLARGLKLRGVTNEGTIGASRRLTHYAMVVLGVALAMRAVGVDLSALFAAGAVFALGLSFAMQNIAQNFVSGMILLLERSIKPGDVLEVEGRVVRVREMGIRATYARTLDDEEIIVPNSTIVQSTVKSYTLRDSVYRLRALVGVTYGSDMALVRRVLETTAAAFPHRLPARDALILMSEFADSSVVWEISVWIDDPWRMRRMRSALQESIWWAFREHGITIAFPQLDVHFDRDVVKLLEGKAA